MLKSQLVQDQIKALKNHDQITLTTIRYILAHIKNKEIEKKGELTEDEIILILRKLTKELYESIEAFKKGGRKDLVVEYEKQLQTTSLYLPKEISDEQLKIEIKKIITTNKELYDKNPKAIIGLCVKQLKSKTDTLRIIKILQSV